MANIDIGVIRERIGRAQQNIITSGIGTVQRVIPATQIITKLPDSLTAATRANIAALTRQQELQKTPVPESLEEISNKLQEAQNSQNIATQLSNFKPLIVGSAVQRRRGVNSRVEGGDNGRNGGRSRAKQQLLSPINALNNEISNKTKELLALGIQKTKLLEQTTLLEKQIGAISAKLQSLINTGASIETIRQWEAMLQKYTDLYEKTKATLEIIKKLYDARYKALEKLRKKRDDLKKSFWKNYKKVMAVLKKFKEIPKKIKFPKLPKLPTLNIRKGNIKVKLMDVINKLKKVSRDAAKTSIAKAKEESQEKIGDPKKGNAFEKAASKARQALQTARQKAEFVQAQRDAILDATIGQVDNQLKRVRAGVDNAQKQVESKIDTVAAKANAAALKAADAKRRAEQLRNSQLAKLDNFAANLAQQAASGIKVAQNALNSQIATADLQSSPNLANRSVEELQKVDELKSSMTNFLNLNNITNFTMGVGIGSTLRSARQQSLTFDQFSAKYPDTLKRGNFDSTNRIGNVNGVYIVITTYYEKTGRPITVAPSISQQQSQTVNNISNESLTPPPPIDITNTEQNPNVSTDNSSQTTNSMVTNATPIVTLASAQSGPTQIPRTTPVNATSTKTTPPTTVKQGSKVLIVGDSITAEFYEGQRTSTWASQFKRKRNDLNVEILAIGGKQLSSWMKPELSKKLKAGEKFSKIVIYGGVNDAFGPYTAQQIFNNLQSMVDQARQSGAQVVVITGYDTQNDMNINKIPKTKYVKTAEGYIPLKNKYIEYQNLIRARLTGATVVPIVRLGELSDGVHPYGSKVITLLNHISPYI